MPPRFSNFSRRWDHREQGPNPLSQALEACKQAGRAVLDLTLSNPTACGLEIPLGWKQVLSSPKVLKYDPHPQGNLQARQAIAQYYAERGTQTDAADFFLTAGTSEGYSHLFKLLCDPGDSVLIPRPSYPLLETLAQLEGIGLNTYPLLAGAKDANGNTSWCLDRKVLEASLTEKTRAIFVVQPNNPTGSILSDSDTHYLLALADSYHLALVVDEVFADFLHGSLQNRDKQAPLRPIRSAGPLVFTLNGLSKLLGLPQLKLAWIHVDGEPSLKSEAKSHLEWICDAYLSVNTASQIACVELLPQRLKFQTPLRERLHANLSCLREFLDKPHSPLEALWPQGGWCIPLRFSKNLSRSKDDETFALDLVRSSGVLTHPGYFFDFDEDTLVLSLLPELEMFREGVRRIAVSGFP